MNEPVLPGMWNSVSCLYYSIWSLAAQQMMVTLLWEGGARNRPGRLVTGITIPSTAGSGWQRCLATCQVERKKKETGLITWASKQPPIQMEATQFLSEMDYLPGATYAGHTYLLFFPWYKKTAWIMMGHSTCLHLFKQKYKPNQNKKVTSCWATSSHPVKETRLYTLGFVLHLFQL